MAKRSRWDQNHPQVRALFEAARKLEQDSSPRKHHVVPDFYLRRWGDQDGRVRVTEVDEHRSYVTKADKAARETDFYSLKHEGVSPDDLPPLLFEAMLGALEGWGQTWITEALELPLGTPPQLAIHPQKTTNFAWFLAFMFTRGRSFRIESEAMTVGMMRSWLAAHDDDVIRAQLRRMGQPTSAENVAHHRAMIDSVVDGTTQLGVPGAKTLANAGIQASYVGEAFLDRVWAIIRTPPILPTCDEPIVVIGGPGAPRHKRYGLELAGVVVFPLAPDALLAMFHQDVIDVAVAGGFELDRVETLQIAREIVGASLRWVIESPSRRLGERIKVPPLPESLQVMNTYAIEENGRDGELISISRATRWAADPSPPPWPVPRWWRGPFVAPRVGPPVEALAKLKDPANTRVQF